tara:strand:- start:4765 stop:5472 length:708 start_codon:yes stop_codon:yes gene_type:complete
MIQRNINRTVNKEVNMALENRFLRNKDLIPQNKLDEIMVIGLGGIGSNVIALLSIMGWDTIIGYDEDKLEEHNLSSCLYPINMLDVPKAKAARDLALAFGAKDADMSEINWTYDLDVMLPKIILATDNMEVRRDAYDEWVKLPNRQLLIDLRMDALAMEIITTTKDNDFFNESWVPSAEIEDAPCTMKHTIFTTSIVSGLGISQLFNFLVKLPYYAYIWVGLIPLSIKKTHLIKG